MGFDTIEINLVICRQTWKKVWTHAKRLFHVNLGSSHHTLQFLLIFPFMWFVDNFYGFWILKVLDHFCDFWIQESHHFLNFRIQKLLVNFFNFWIQKYQNFCNFWIVNVNFFILLSDFLRRYFFKPAWSRYYWLSDS